MSARRQLGTCAVVLAGLLLAYVGAYLGIYKNDLGRRIFGNTYQARGIADILHRVAAHFFAPIRRMEYWHNEAQLKQYLEGEWVTGDDHLNVNFGPDMQATVTGFSVIGFPDDSNCSTHWDYRGSADYGTAAMPTPIISSSHAGHSLEVLTIDMTCDEIHVNLRGLGFRGAALLKRKTTSTR